jgi:hypothetical protein
MRGVFGRMLCVCSLSALKESWGCILGLHLGAAVSYDVVAVFSFLLLLLLGGSLEGGSGGLARTEILGKEVAWL